jgi:hypothetical protein
VKIDLPRIPFRIRVSALRRRTLGRRWLHVLLAFVSPVVRRGLDTVGLCGVVSGDGASIMGGSHMQTIDVQGRRFHQRRDDVA